MSLGSDKAEVDTLSYLAFRWGCSLGWGFPSGTSGKESTCRCRRCKRHGFDPWVGKIPWRREWQPTPVFLPGGSHGRRSLVGCRLWGRTESDTTKRFSSSSIHRKHLAVRQQGELSCQLVGKPISGLWCGHFKRKYQNGRPICGFKLSITVKNVYLSVSYHPCWCFIFSPTASQRKLLSHSVPFTVSRMRQYK